MWQLASGRIGNPAAMVPLGYSAEAAQFFARVADPGTTRKGHYATLIDGLVADAVWTTELDALYIFAAADEATALTSLISATYNATAVSSPVFTADTGYTGATGDTLDTNFNPTTASSPKFTQDSASMFAWSLKEAADAGGIQLYASAGYTTYLTTRNTGDDKAYGRANSNNDVSAVVATGTGLLSANRSLSNASQLYKNGSSIATNSAASVAPENSNFVFLSTAFTGQVAAGGFGLSMNATKQAALYNRIHTYLQAVAGVP